VVPRSVTFQGDGGHNDHGHISKLPFQSVLLRLPWIWLGSWNTINDDLLKLVRSSERPAQNIIADGMIIDVSGR